MSVITLRNPALIKAPRPILLCLVLCQLCSCGIINRHSSANNFDSELARLQLSAKTLQSRPFKHLVVENHALSKSLNSRLATKRLHIYLHGDGRVWQQGRRVSPDPSPTHLLMLGLMSLDDTPSLHLGRPCYFQSHFSAPDPECNPLYWTSARYHRLVVASLRNVVKHYRDMGFDELWLIGFSGGGSLASLISQMADNSDTESGLTHKEKATRKTVSQKQHERATETQNAEEIPQKMALVDNTSSAKLISGVVSLAANLDTTTWANSQHSSGLLAHSLNPFEKPINPAVTYIHFEAKYDRNVQNHTTSRFKQRFTEQSWYRLPIDHSCCWREYWPSILALIKKPEKPQALLEPFKL